MHTSIPRSFATKCVCGGGGGGGGGELNLGYGKKRGRGKGFPLNTALNMKSEAILCSLCVWVYP